MRSFLELNFSTKHIALIVGLNSYRGEVTIITGSIREESPGIISDEIKQRLLRAQKELSVYMITKTDKRIYYGLWGFLDVRLGITFLSNQTEDVSHYRHLKDNWNH